MKVICKAEIHSNKEIAPGIFDMLLGCADVVKYAHSGQFVNVYSKKGETILPRPISIAGIDSDTGTLRLIYAVVGKGTEEFSKLSAGDTVRIMGPLGNGFMINENLTQHLIVAGGIGTPPMLELAKHLKGEVKVYLGFRTNPILVEEFEKIGAEVHLATDDGSAGFKGNNVALLRQDNPSAQMIYSCGPKVMLKALAAWAQEKKIPLQVSMEERMACGIGACVGCVCKTKSEEAPDGWEHKKVCMNGPVFMSDEVIWDE